MGKLAKSAASLGLAIALVGSGLVSAKEDISKDYKDKYMVVMREGLVLEICQIGPCYLRVRVSESGVDTSQWPSDFTPEPVRKGEVLRSFIAAVRGKWLELYVKSLSPHSITRGNGAFQQESLERPSAILMFPLDEGPDQAKALIARWLRTFGTQEEAAKFGNTASGVFVK